MLIEMKVENFGSIRERQTLSMVASKAIKEHRETHVLHPSLGSMHDIALLPSGAVYGANASGKSTLVRALWRMQNFILNSDQMGSEGNPMPGQIPPPRVPFKLAPEWDAKPSRFEVSFIQDQVRCQYGFALGKLGIEEEYLLTYPKGRSQVLFERGPKEWYLNRALGPKTRDLQERTRPGALFLSVAARWNHALLTPIHAWFKDRLRGIDCSILAPFTFFQAWNDESVRTRLVSFIKRADFGLQDVTSQLLPSRQINIQADTGKVDLMNGQAVLPHFMHSRSDGTGTVPFEIFEESGGTQRYLALAGPWLDALANGRTLVVDELETNLHPLLVRKLIEVFHSPEHNPRHAQLIFATHQTALLDPSLMRRDQIWLVEKNAEGATQVSPLTDFSPRNQEALQKGYLSGRYGAIPLLEEGLL